MSELKPCREAFEVFARKHLRKDGPFLRECGLIDSPFTYADPDIEDAWQDWHQLTRTPDTSAVELVRDLAETLKIYANRDLFVGSFYPSGHSEAEKALAKAEQWLKNRGK